MEWDGSFRGVDRLCILSLYFAGDIGMRAGTTQATSALGSIRECSDASIQEICVRNGLKQSPHNGIPSQAALPRKLEIKVGRLNLEVHGHFLDCYSPLEALSLPRMSSTKSIDV